MTETVRYSKVYLDDLAIGTGSGQVVLADGRVVVMQEINPDAIAARLAGTTSTGPYKVLTGNWSVLDGYATLDEALDAIGSSTRLLIVAAATIISVNTTIPANVELWVLGEGFFTCTATLTLNCKLHAPLRAIFNSTADVQFGKQSVYGIHPEWWGAIADGSTDCTDAVQSAMDAAHADGGLLLLGAGDYNFDTTLTPQGELTIQGMGMDVTRLMLTDTDTLLHGMESTFSLYVKDLTINVTSPPTTDEQMSGIRVDLDGTALTGRNVLYENVKCHGFNLGLFADGGSQFGIDQVTMRNIDVKNSGPASSYVGSAFHIHRSKKGYVDGAILDKNNTGEHGGYCSGAEVFEFKNMVVKNVFNTSAAVGLKIVGESAVARSYYSWSVDNCTVIDSANGILIETYQSDTLESVRIANCSFKNITDVTNPSSSTGIHISAAGTASKINSVHMSNLSFNDIAQQCITTSTGANCEMGVVVLDGARCFDWSNSAAGTYSVIGTTSSNGTIRLLGVHNVYAHGNTTNGRTIFHLGSINSNVKRMVYSGLVEVATVLPGWPIQFADADTTPSVAHGCCFYVNNTGGTTVTRLDDMFRGQRYLLYHANGNTTYDHGANIVCQEGVDMTPASGQVVEFYSPDGLVAYEVNSNRT